MDIREKILELIRRFHSEHGEWPTEVVLPLEQLEEIEDRLGRDTRTVFGLRIVEGQTLEVR